MNLRKTIIYKQFINVCLIRFSILSTIVGMYLLWLQLGVSIFAGLGVLIVIALLNVVIVRETKKYQVYDNNIFSHICFIL